MSLDATFALRFRAISGRDSRFDGSFYTCVLTTSIYCLPSCPSRTPNPENCHFVTSREAARAAGFRACKRCFPDSWQASPTEFTWPSSELAERAYEWIRRGYLDSSSVSDLASKLHTSDRTLQRALSQVFGATAVQLAVAGRVERALALLGGTTMNLTEVAFAAGFSSVRQFNEVMLRENGVSPRESRRKMRCDSISEPRPAHATSTLTLRLPFTGQYFTEGVLATLRAHTVAGQASHEILSHEDSKLAADSPTGAAPTAMVQSHQRHTRTAQFAHGPARISFDASSFQANSVTVHVKVQDLRDLQELVRSVRRWLDLDADPEQICRALSEDSDLASMLQGQQGVRVVQAIDPHEAGLLAVLGQQVSLSAANTFAARLVKLVGEPLPSSFSFGPPSLLFPTAAAVAGLTESRCRAEIGMTGARTRTFLTLATRLAAGTIDLSRRSELLAVPGIGPWTADVIALRASGDPDAFAPSDLVVRRALGLEHLSAARGASMARQHAESWRPFRGYAMSLLWYDACYSDSRTRAPRSASKKNP